MGEMGAYRMPKSGWKAAEREGDAQPVSAKTVENREAHARAKARKAAARGSAEAPEARHRDGMREEGHPPRPRIKHHPGVGVGDDFQRLQEWIMENNLDAKAARLLVEVPLDIREQVTREPLGTAHNPSSALVVRVRAAQRRSRG